MNESRSPTLEALEDVFFGQAVIIWARWFVIVAVAILVLWSSSSVSELTIATLLIVPLIAVNFFVHGRYLLERPANRNLLRILSLGDLLIITLMITVWGDVHGLKSPFFILYYPVVLAFAFVFPLRDTIFLTLATLGAYLGGCLIADLGWVRMPQEIEFFVMRAITLAATGGLSTYYWRIQRKRRREAEGPALAPEL